MEETPAMGLSAVMMCSMTGFFVLVMAPILLEVDTEINRATTEDTIAVLEVITLIAGRLTLMFGRMICLGMVLILVVLMMPKNA
jgi:hypothetical protein